MKLYTNYYSKGRLLLYKVYEGSIVKKLVTKKVLCSKGMTIIFGCLGVLLNEENNNT